MSVVPVSMSQRGYILAILLDREHLEILANLASELDQIAARRPDREIVVVVRKHRD